MSQTTESIQYITAGLAVICGLCWGLVPLRESYLAATLTGFGFGQTKTSSRIVYALIGIAPAPEAVNRIALARRNRAHAAAA